MPRFRIDHLLNFNWKFLVPLSLINLVVTSLVAVLVDKPGSGASFWELLPRWGIFFGVNVLLALVTFLFLQSVARRERQKEEALGTLEPATEAAQG